MTAYCITATSLLVTNQTVLNSGENSGNYDSFRWASRVHDRVSSVEMSRKGPFQDGGHADRHLQQSARCLCESMLCMAEDPVCQQHYRSDGQYS